MRVPFSAVVLNVLRTPQVPRCYQESLITVFSAVFTCCLLLQLHSVSEAFVRVNFRLLFLVRSGPLWRPT